MDYDRYDALELAQLVRNREVTASELLEDAIARAERVNPQINGLASRRYERAREDAAATALEGPFAGVPFLVKDLGVELAGVPFTKCSRYFKDYVPAADHEFITRVKAAGLNIFAKTSAPEFGLMPYTEPALFGACRNPWNLERTPGGSSGGSAALVAAGVVPMAHGNDMGGSIRIPASCTGLFGMKPSRGRAPSSFTSAGDANVDLCLSRSVRDSAALLDAVRHQTGTTFAPPPPERPYLEEVSREPGRLRIAVVRGPMLGHGISAQARVSLDDAANLLASLGHDVSDGEPDGLDYDGLRFALLMIFAVQIAVQLGELNPMAGKPLRPGDIEPASLAMLTIGRVLAAEQLAVALARQRRLSDALAAFMTQHDVILTPTLAAPPVRIGELALTPAEKQQIAILTRVKLRPLIQKAAIEIAARMFDWLPYTPIFNLTGQPAMSVPLYWTDDGLPMGMQFAARYGDEATLFRLAGQLERARPWFDKRPPIAARAAVPTTMP
jgi:amidase